MYVFQPYFKAKVGPVTMQGEINYAFGEREFENPSTNDDRDINSLTAFFDADANFGMFSVGGSLAYVRVRILMKKIFKMPSPAAVTGIPA